MVDSLLDFVFNVLKSMGSVFEWLNSPFLTYDNMPLGFLILERLGVDIQWMYTLTPLQLIGASLVTFLTTILIIKFVGMILDAIPII